MSAIIVAVFAALCMSGITLLVLLPIVGALGAALAATGVAMLIALAVSYLFYLSSA